MSEIVSNGVTVWETQAEQTRCDAQGRVNNYQQGLERRYDDGDREC
jgi:hypothetical protein